MPGRMSSLFIEYQNIRFPNINDWLILRINVFLFKTRDQVILSSICQAYVNHVRDSSHICNKETTEVKLSSVQMFLRQVSFSCFEVTFFLSYSYLHIK